MKKYKVIALSVGGLNNKIFRSGDTVVSTNFPQGNAEKLEAAGFLKEIKEEPTVKPEVTPEEPETAEAKRKKK